MAKQNSAKKRIGITFPLAGLNRRGAYRQQPPYTTPSCLNVRAVGTIEGRERGGSRPGLIESHIDDLGGSIRMLSPMTLALGDGFTFWSDTFSGSSMAAAWTQASWATAMPSILPQALASVDYTIAEGEAVLDALPIDTTKAYAVEIFLTPWSGAFHGDYRLYFRLNNTTPAILTEGVVVELVSTGTAGAYTASMKSYVASVASTIDTATGTLTIARPGWLTATVSGTTITVYWCGTEIMSGTVGAQTGSRVGFGMECTVAGGICLANVFRVQYFSTGSVPQNRSMLIGSASGSLFKETTYGRMSAVSSSLTLRDDTQICAVQSGQELFIADYGDLRVTGTDGTVSTTSLDATGVADWSALGIDSHDDVVVISNVAGGAVAGTYKIQTVAAGNLTLTASAGSGTCTYRIERAPKVYNPLTNTLSQWTATTGQVPTGCPLICRVGDRIILGGAAIAPHVWYAPRKGNPLDFDYSQTDSLAAVAGTASQAGVPGDPLTAIVAHGDDYWILSCLNSLWRMNGDPAIAGLSNLSHTVGIIDKKAWCLGPGGELIFLSLDGLYALSPGGNSYPIPLSRETLPQEFLNLDPNLVTASLEYDVQGHGIHIYLTPESSNARVHWWMDWERKTFWPLSLDSDHEPTCTCTVQATAIEDSGVILGGRDGKLRRLSDLAETDCGEIFTSYVVVGPIALAADSRVGRIISMDAEIAEESGDVVWALRPSLTFEGSVSSNNSDTGTWVDGLNATVYPTCRGQACTLKISNATGRKWEVENITAIVAQGGRRRIL